jgi:hypothetical protein
METFGLQQDRILRCPLGPDKIVPTKGFAETLFEGLKRSPKLTALVSNYNFLLISLFHYLNSANDTALGSNITQVTISRKQKMARMYVHVPNFF